jgi:hypothetical protein
MRQAITFTLLVGLCWLSPARGQPPGGKPPFPPGGMLGPPGPPSALMLLTEKSVQTDLKTTAAQNRKISAASAKMHNTMRSMFGLPPDQAMAKMQEVMKTNDEAALDILKEDQKKRLNQITLQLQGSQAFAAPDVVKELNLSQEQQDRIKAIHDAAGQKMPKLVPGQPFAPQVFQKKVAQIKKDADKQAQKVLTSEQASQWSEIIGSPFRGQVRMLPLPGFGPPPGVPPRQ